MTGVSLDPLPFCLPLSESLGLSPSLSLSLLCTQTPALGARWRLSWQPSRKIIKTLLLTIVPDEVLIQSEAGAVGRMLKSLALCGGLTGIQTGLQQEARVRPGGRATREGPAACLPRTLFAADHHPPPSPTPYAVFASSFHPRLNARTHGGWAKSAQSSH